MTHKHKFVPIALNIYLDPTTIDAVSGNRVVKSEVLTKACPCGAYKYIPAKEVE